MRVHRALCSPLIDGEMFRAALGAGRGDISSVGRYMALPPDRRPALSVYFDAQFYAATNPQAMQAGEDPLVHFVDQGLAALRPPHPMIDLRYILAEDPVALGKPPDMSALVDLLDYDLLSSSPYFDMVWYAEQLGERAPANGLLRHLLTTGLAEGLGPNAWFDPAWYAAQHDDAPKTPYGALRHFVTMGDAAGLSPGPSFDGNLYRRRYTDVADSGIPPLLHYLTHGRAEGRQIPSERRARPVQAAAAGPAAAVAVAEPFAVTPEAVLADDDAMRRVLDKAQQARKDAVKVKPPKVAVSRTPLKDLARITLPVAEAPRLSILVPAFNELDHTVACLLAVAKSAPRVAFEVVLADDCSTDPDVAHLADVPNLVYLRQTQNLGFIGNCNAAFAQCRGEYVLLLNNDAQPLPGALDALVAALDADPAVAAAGPKLLYPDGRLQEAGCHIRINGESEMIGLFADPNEGGYCRNRDVTYCSGAALLLRRSAVGERLFDPAFAPAYCEDADLCLRLIDAGHRVRYVHSAHVVHWLSVSTNREAQARKLRRITRNQALLSERWADLLARLNALRPIAFYLPQFHPTPENDLWWGSGFTEWTNVVKARPSYEGHYQPHLPTDLGFYDLRVADALRRQADLAARYGLAGFCVYYYNFGSRRVLGAPLDVLRANPDIAFNYCLCWANENWTKHWDGGTREVLLEQSYDAATLASIIADAVEHAAGPRYLRVDGKPVFLVYRPLKLPDIHGFADDCRAAFARAGFAGVHLVYVESMEAVDEGIEPEAIGFDACVEFPPHGRATPAETKAAIVKEGWSGYRYDYPQTVRAFTKRDTVPYVRYPAVFPSWDNTPRQPMKGTSFDGASPEAFRVYAEEKIDEARRFLMGEERLLFVNAWNEWAEGAHLEPDTGFGHRWLEALRDAMTVKRWA